MSTVNPTGLLDEAHNEKAAHFSAKKEKENENTQKTYLNRNLHLPPKPPLLHLPPHQPQPIKIHPNLPKRHHPTPPHPLPRHRFQRLQQRFPSPSPSPTLILLLKRIRRTRMHAHGRVTSSRVPFREVDGLL